ncbi:hypothetical protein [Aggregatilinea lenta]|uniref:hypothetical protein n=1 Tax=Aggregatilinea lenta TaxID=913108 RepID=UPI0013C35AA1|nr:hypothetical protein [Aggregatilinea lenta]
MVLLLMLDDPTTKLALFLQANETGLDQAPVVLFQEIKNPAQIYGLDVQDVTQSRRLFLLRDDTTEWTVSQAAGLDGLAAESAISQQPVELAAYAVGLMTATEWYDATPDALTIYGLAPQPSYRIGLAARDTAGVTFLPVILEVGDSNPDLTAHYIWPQGDSRIYLIPDEILEPVLSLVTNAEQLTILPDGASTSDPLDTVP